MTYETSSLVHLAVGLLPVLLAQDTTGINETTVDDAAAAAGGAGGLLIGLISYLVGSFFCWKIFAKCGVENAWFAWIPILNVYANFQAGDEENPLLWTILSIVPCVNIIAIVKLIIAWTKIAQKLGKSPWLLLISLIPLGALFVLGYFAFG